MDSQRKQNADLAYARGVAAQTAGRLAEAMDEWRCASIIDPQHGPALYNLAVALTLTKDEKAAEEIYEKLLALHPAHQDALYNLANQKNRQGCIPEAELLYRRLIEAHPDFVAGWVNLAKLYSDRRDSAEAEPLLRKALEIDPQHAVAHWNLSHLLLRTQRWAEGWREYEWRLRLPKWLASPVEAPAWDGNSKAHRILLWNDQGIGDAIQFLRYPRLLAERGHEVFVLVQDGLKKIAGTAPGVARAFGPSDPMPMFDAQAPLPSMPHRLGFPDPLSSWQDAYLTADRPLELPRRPGHRAIGLVWAGNQRHKNDANRSAALADLMPLFDIPGLDWYSLQFGDAAAQIHENNLVKHIHDLSPRLHNFADTATALSALDLVISVDTSVAHLAGALGRPCYVMLSATPDWRWDKNKTTSPWYPSQRVFLQPSPGDWQGVTELIANALA